MRGEKTDAGEQRKAAIDAVDCSPTRHVSAMDLES